MNKVTLDLTGVKFPQEMHRKFQKVLGFPDYYGNNWDAFWDCIMNDSTVEYIEILGESKVSPALRSMVEELRQILQKVKIAASEQGWAFDYKFVD